MTYMTPEQFLAMPSDPEEDADYNTPLTPPPYDVEPLAPGPGTALESIAVSLQEIARTLMGGGPGAELVDGPEVDQLCDRIAELEAEVSELDDLLTSRSAQLDEIRAAVKPSVSKLANAVREVLDGTTTSSEEPAGAPEGVLEHTTPDDATPDRREIPEHVKPLVETAPPADAGVDAWRLHAKLLGHSGADVDVMNRSQIRTLLGLAHPDESAV